MEEIMVDLSTFTPTTKDEFAQLAHDRKRDFDLLRSQGNGRRRFISQAISSRRDSNTKFVNDWMLIICQRFSKHMTC
jgi:hypothetical protein